MNCSISGCVNTIRAYGLCSTHYDKRRLAGRRCSKPECNLPVQARNLCGTHYKELRWEELGKPLCIVDGCDRRAVIIARGLCSLHYQRWQAIDIDRGSCQIVGCSQPAQVRGFCRVHLQADRRKNRSPFDKRAYNLAGKVKISVEEARTLVATMPDHCESCNDPAPQLEDLTRPRSSCLHYDHDHKTGNFRGWLCGNCNRAAGLLQDDPERARKLADYLSR